MLFRPDLDLLLKEAKLVDGRQSSFDAYGVLEIPLFPRSACTSRFPHLPTAAQASGTTAALYGQASRDILRLSAAAATWRKKGAGTFRWGSCSFSLKV